MNSTRGGVEAARRRYRPKPIRVAFVAEAPPRDPGRFFYFPEVPTRDALFLATMRALYTDASKAVAGELREHKKQFLLAFQRDGFLLLDACVEPMPMNATPTQKRRSIRKALPRLRKRLVSACRTGQPVILISRTVYDVTHEELRAAGLNVVNTEPIAFPANGHAHQFHEGLRSVLGAAGLDQKSSGVLPLHRAERTRRGRVV